MRPGIAHTGPGETQGGGCRIRRKPKGFNDVLAARAGKRGLPVFYSLIESAKLAGVEPRAYLGEAARRGIRSPAGRDDLK